LKDETGEIRVALWGDKADADIDLADHVVVTDAEIGDGWQDDLEASANWRSTVTVLEDADTRTGASEAGATGASTADSGLGEFADGGETAADSTSTGGASTTATATDEDEPTTDDGAATVDETEFTGTVVQTGDPIVLDDGQQTRQVETDASLRLGEEVTVRGPERDGTIHAADVF
jgi:replication factor A1